MRHYNRPIYVCGYAATFGSPSVGLRHGRREMIATGAFDHALKSNAPIKCSVHHLDGAVATIASTACKTLELWTDNYGLAFRAGPIAANSTNLAIVRSICCNDVRGASWAGDFAETATEVVDGEPINLVRKFQNLDHVGPVVEPMYADSCSWCSHESVDDMPLALRLVENLWSATRPVTRTRPRLTATPKVAARAPALLSGRLAADRRDAISAAVSLDTPRGFTTAQWLDFGRMEAAGRRAYEHEQQRRRQRDRARRAARLVT